MLGVLFIKIFFYMEIDIMYKKLLSIVAVCWIISSIPAFAAYEKNVDFSRVGSYYEETYTTDFVYNDGGVKFIGGNISLNSLPYLSENRGDIYSFCFYHDKLYYLTAEEASDYVPASIYACNPDGSNPILIADNACNYSNITIVDNILYYDAYASYEDDYYPGYYGGIYKINLGDCSWQKLVGDSDAVMKHCNGDYIYYTANNGYWAISTDGTFCVNVSAQADEILCNDYDLNVIVKSNTTYYVDDYGNILFRPLNSYNADDAKLVAVCSGNPKIRCITEQYLYYSIDDFNTNRSYVYRVNL